MMVMVMVMVMPRVTVMPWVRDRVGLIPVFGRAFRPDSRQLLGRVFSDCEDDGTEQESGGQTRANSSVKFEAEDVEGIRLEPNVTASI
jgi:hypothetical protein